MVHAEAARQARAEGDRGAELREASRVSTLLAVLEQECRERRTARRVLREADAVRWQAHALSEALDAVENEIREIIDVSRGMREDQQRRTAHLVDACRQKMADDVIRLTGERQVWHQNVTDLGPQVARDWDKEQAALVAGLDEALKARLGDLAREIDEAATAAEREWTTVIRPHLKVEGLVDFRGLWTRRAVGVVIGAGGVLACMAIGAYARSSARPAGTVLGSVVISLGPVLVAPLRKKVQSLFTGKAEILEANRALLRSEIGKVLGELEDHALAEVSGIIAEVREALDAVQARRAKAEAAALAVADLLACQRQTADSAISTLDQETDRCLLRLGTPVEVIRPTAPRSLTV
jgi:hypothetical protein